MTLAQWFSHRGRISRKTWWIFYCLVPICLMGVLVEARRIILLGVETPQKSSVVEYIIIAVFKVLPLMMLWIGFAGLTKRWHDQDQSCWWIVLLFAPNIFFTLLSILLWLADLDGSSRWDYRGIAGFFAGMMLFLLPVTILSAGLQPGTLGPNRFGPDPLAPPDAANIALPPQPQ
jgi:uncharacterized membrane protein YhaH (DUF805 family)